MTNKTNKIIRLTVFGILVAVALALVVYTLYEMKQVVHYLDKIDRNINFRTIFREMKLKGILSIISLQILFVMSIVVPSTPIQMVAGLAYNPFFATFILMVGICIGSVAMFLLSRIIGQEVIAHYQKKNNEFFVSTLAIVQKANSKIWLLSILLYLLPVLPYGLISLVMGNSKLRTWQYALICFFGSFVDCITNAYLGHILRAPSLAFKIIVYSIFIIALIVIFANTKRIFKWITKVTDKD